MLFSGGLDSIITVKLLQEQDITVDALYIENGFRRDYKLQYLRDILRKITLIQMVYFYILIKVFIIQTKDITLSLKI